MRPLHLVVALAATTAMLSAACGQPRAAPSPTPSPTSAPPPKSSQVGVGDTVNLTGLDGQQIATTLTKVADPAQPTSEIEAPGNGKRLVGVQLRLRNNGTVTYDDSPDNSATLIDADSQRITPTIVTEITAGPVFPGSVRIAGGDSAVGFVIFEVPKQARAARLQFALDSGMAPQTAEWTLPPPSRSSPPPSSSSPPVPPPTGTPAGPAAIVQSYYAAINEQDYQAAWALGGKNLSPSYEEFVDGFAATRHDTLSVVSASGETVSIQLDAEQTDGSHRRFAGTYTVHDGVIVAADVAPR